MFQFDAVTVINLKRRPDRLKEFWDEIDDCDWPFKKPEVFEAVDGQVCIPPEGFKEGPYAWACFQSHRHVIENAINSRHQSLLVLEDDVTFTTDRFRQRCETFMNEVPDDWDFVWLGGHHMQDPVWIKPGIVRSIHMDRMHAYGVRGKALIELYRYWHQWHIGHCDWAISEWIRQFNSYCVMPWLCGQRGGFSDIRFEIQGANFWPKLIDEPTEEEKLNPKVITSLYDKEKKLVESSPCPHRRNRFHIEQHTGEGALEAAPAYGCSHPRNLYQRCTLWKTHVTQSVPACETCPFDKKAALYPRFSACMPTRGRADRAVASINSFFETTKGFDVEMVVVSHPDEAVRKISEYQKAHPQYNLKLTTADCTAIEGWNIAASMATGFFLKVWDDDLIAQPRWLDAAMLKWEVIGRLRTCYIGLWDDDSRVPHALFTRAFGTRDFFVNVCGGVLCIPHYKRWWDDNEKFDRAQAVGCGFACMDSKIIHYQAAKGTGPWDDTANLGAERGIWDMQTYQERKAQGFPNNYPPMLKAIQ